MNRLRLVLFLAALLPGLLLGLASPACGGEAITSEFRTGFGGGAYPGRWMPVFGVLTNHGPPVEGTLTIEATKEDLLTQTSRTNSHTYPLNLPRGGSQTLQTVVLHSGSYFLSLTYEVRSDGGERLAGGAIPFRRREAMGHLRPTQDGTLVISRDDGGFEFLETGDRKVYYTRPRYLPASWAAYHQIGTIILHDADPEGLHPEQVDSLLTWMAQGRTLIITGGSDLHTLFASDLMQQLLPLPVPQRRPVDLADENQETRGDLPRLEVDSPLNVWQFPSSGDTETLIRAGEIPLLKTAEYRGGTVHLITFDPHSGPLGDWTEREQMYRLLLNPCSTPDFPAFTLDIHADTMFGSVAYSFPGRMLVVLITVILVLSTGTLYLIFRKVPRGRLKTITSFLLLSAVLWLCVHLAVGRDTIQRNQILFEVGLMETTPRGENAAVDSILTYSSLYGAETTFDLDTIRGAATGLSPGAPGAFGDAFHLISENHTARIPFDKENDVLNCGLRTQYSIPLPITFSRTDAGGEITLKVENRTDHDLGHIYLYHRGDWYELRRAGANATTRFTIDSRTPVRTRPPWSVTRFESARQRLHYLLMGDVYHARIRPAALEFGQDTFLIGALMGSPPDRGAIQTGATHKFHGLLIVPLSQPDRPLSADSAYHPRDQQGGRVP